MLKQIFNNQSKTITSAAIVLGVASLTSRLLGLFRDRLLAGTFGAGDELDIYFAAFRIPDLVYSLLVVGALSAGFIPVFISYLNGVWPSGRDQSLAKARTPNEEAWYLANDILNILIISLILICGILVIFTPWLMKLVTPGFSEEKLAMTVALTRIMFLSPIFLGVSAVLGGILQSFKRFFVFSLSPIFYNLGIIFGVLVLVKFWGIYGLGFGVILGAFLHMIIQIPASLFSGFRYRLVFDFAHSGIKKIGQLMIPRTLSLGVSQLNFLAMTIIASTLTGGSIAVFNFAYNIWSFPLGIIATSYAIAAFPTIAEQAAKKDWLKFSQGLSSAFRQILFFIIPASVFLIVLRAQIVRIILGTGKFDWQDTILTIESLQYLTLGLFADSLVLLLIRGFFALEDTKTPFVLGLISTATRLISALIFVKYLSLAGLALGFSLGSILYLILLWFYLRKRVGDLDQKQIWQSSCKIFISALLAGLTCYLMLRVIAPLVNMQTGLGILTQVLGAGLVGILVYILVGLFLGLKEMISFYKTIISRLPWQEVAPTEEVINQP